MFWRSHRVLGAGEVGSLMLAWEIRNHWSHCWDPMRPAVSSLEGQKSIRMHYRAGGVVTPAHAGFPPHMHTLTTHRASHSALCAQTSYGFLPSFHVPISLMWQRGDCLYCDTKLFLERKKWNDPILLLFLKERRATFSSLLMPKEQTADSQTNTSLFVWTD